MTNLFLKLPFQFDVLALQEDLKICERWNWSQHYNQNDYQGDWTGIALRSPTGKHLDINALAVNKQQFKDTDLLLACPFFQKILNNLLFEKAAVRLLALAPGSSIKPHRDPGLGYAFGEFRLHIPIISDDGVEFYVEEQAIPMKEGQCWYVDFDKMHRVTHRGVQRRVHLVIDGYRNAWTDEVFKNAGYDFSVENQEPVYDAATRAQIIAQLRLMDAEGARILLQKML
ncbi:MAG: aspartyl/asparaginyl beta-hydroxylase domain-containing protein [Lewinellaceae bacterium]|nr:aspartyl/asparaginyl beta-hydroxylase domain-containing protein [Lewinellaceae bacterium]